MKALSKCVCIIVIQTIILLSIIGCNKDEISVNTSKGQIEKKNLTKTSLDTSKSEVKFSTPKVITDKDWEEVMKKAPRPHKLDDFDFIQEGMTIKEIVYRLGAPNRLGRPEICSASFFEYDVEDGKPVEISFSDSNNKVDKVWVSNLKKHLSKRKKRSLFSQTGGYFTENF